jgi:hypothetical protein
MAVVRGRPDRVMGSGGAEEVRACARAFHSLCPIICTMNSWYTRLAILNSC